MVRKALDLLSGEVRIRVRGASLERFLNACTRGGIGLRHTRRVDFGEMHATVSIRDFRRLRKSMGRTGCRIHILRRRGAPFMLHRLRRRYALFAGAFAALALFLALNHFIWVVEIHAQPGISTYELRQRLQEAGAYAGAPVRSIDENAIREHVRTAMEDTVDFVTVSRLGNRITVEAFGGDGDPQTLDDRAVTGVVAARDGRITDLQVLGGYPLVKKGDAVARGQKLISAVTPPATEQGLGYIGHGWGRITAQTSHTETSVRLLQRIEKQYTGRKKTQFALVFGRRRLNLYLGSGISAGTCEKRVTVKRLAFGRGTVLPVTLIRQDYRYYTGKPAEDPPEQVREAAEQAALERLRADMVEGQIDAWNSEAEELPGGLRLTLHAGCTENIGREISEEGVEIPQKQPEPDGGA